MVALPAAESEATFAFSVNAVGEADFENRFGGLVGDFHDAKREGMKIEQEFSIFEQAAAGDVAVAEDHVAAGVFGGIGAD